YLFAYILYYLHNYCTNIGNFGKVCDRKAECFKLSANFIIIASNLNLTLKDSILSEILGALKNSERFGKDELQTLLAKDYTDSSRQTLAWRRHDLKKRGLIQQVSRGMYPLRLQKSTY